MSDSTTSARASSTEPSRKKLFGVVAVAKGFCTDQQVQECLSTQEKIKALGVPERIGGILVKKGYLTPEQLEAVKKELRQRPVLAGFELLEKAGQGGMGAVFRARQISMDRIVALKLLPRKLAADPIYKERFFREARLCAKLSHPNLINAIDVGEAGGYTYFAMEYVEGETLKERLKKEGRLALDECLALIRQVAGALLYAHGQKLIHRDVKPDNIMLNRHGEAKLCDLGLARLTGADEEDAGLTMSGKALGTPHYISPEQAKGLADIDGRSDIYSLGATLYHLLGGRTLFSGQNATAIMAQHLSETAPALNEVCADVPAPYAAIVAKMLAKSREDRYADLADFLKDLDAVAAGRASSAAHFQARSSCTMPPRSGRSGRRRPLAAGATTGPRAPIGGRGTTGPRRPIRPRHTTGPVMSVGPIRVTTGPASPVGGRRETARASAAASNSKKPTAIYMLAAALGVAVLLIGGLILASSSTSEERRSAKHPHVTLPANRSTTRNAKTERPKTRLQPAAQPKRPLQPLRALPSPAPGPKPKPLPVQPASRPIPTPTLAPTPPTAPPPKPAPTTPPKAAPASGPAAHPVETAKPVPPAAPKLPDPRIPLLRSRFLTEMVKRAAKHGLGKVEQAMQDVAREKAYRPARKALAEDFQDLQRAAAFEQEALKALAAKGGQVALPEKFAKTFGAKSAKINGFEPGRGLSVNVKGAGLYLSGAMLPPDKVAAAHPPKRGAGAALYLLARGALGPARKQLSKLSEKERARLAEKLELMKAGEKEISAQLAHERLAALFREKKWKPLLQALGAFGQAHGATAFARSKAAERASWKTAAEKALEPPNPWRHVFHARTVKTRRDGFVELSYDFSTPAQLQDFACEHGQLSVNKGYLNVPRGGDEWAQARFLAPIGELLHLEATGRSTTRSPRFGIYFLSPNNTQGQRAPRCMCRQYNHKPHLERWRPPFAKFRIPQCNAIGPKRVDWQTKDITFTAEVQGREFAWTVGGDEVGKVRLPKNWKGGNIAFISVRGGHVWKEFKLVFKPEAQWARQKLDALKKSIKR